MKALSCVFGHKWEGCKCARCGEKREEGHAWDKCRGICARCGKSRAQEHDWRGCKCLSCGSVRDESHRFEKVPGKCEEKCAICGKITAAHAWVEGKCSACGAAHANDLSEFQIDFFGVMQKYLGNAAKVVVPDSIKIVGYRSFSECISVKEVVFSGDAKLGKAFENSASLERVEMHGGSVGDSAFANCRNLRVADLSGVGQIDPWAFKDCVNLEKCVISPGVKIPYPSSFYNCSKLEALTLEDGTKHPDSCSLLDRHEFDGCVCVRCGKAREWPEHAITDGKCSRCGKTEQEILDRRNSLIKELKTAGDWEKRRDAAEALGNHPSADTVAALISSLQQLSESWVVRFKCAATLGKIKDSTAVAPLIAALEDASDSVVEHSAEALGLMGDERAIEPLIRHLNPEGQKYGSNYMPVEACYTALAKFGPRVTGRLLECLGNEGMYGGAIRALALIGDKAAMPALVGCALDARRPRHFRADAIMGLGRIDCPESADALRKLLGDLSDPSLVSAVEGALKKLGIDASESLRAADRRAAESFLANLKALKVGMSEDEVYRLVGGAAFQMGKNVVFKNQYGDFQLIIVNGRLAEFPGGFGPAGLIKRMEEELRGGE